MSWNVKHDVVCNETGLNVASTCSITIVVVPWYMQSSSPGSRWFVFYRFVVVNCVIDLTRSIDLTRPGLCKPKQGFLAQRCHTLNSRWSSHQWWPLSPRLLGSVYEVVLNLESLLWLVVKGANTLKWLSNDYEWLTIGPLRRMIHSHWTVI